MGLSAIVGIDLGTTNSLVAVWRDGRAQVLPNALGDPLTPSCVSLDADGTVLVGRAARERLQTHPHRTAALFKRSMGTQRTVELDGRSFRPEELSALVLRSLRQDAEAALGHAIDEAVISVPAYFSDAQRKATRAAGQIAGLKVERLVNEPTAAALACGLHHAGSERRFLVFDLGGGTFDVSVLELFEGVMEVRASAGDNHLGGEDWTDCLVALFFEQMRLPSRLRTEAAFMQRLVAGAEAAKCALSAAPETTLRVVLDGQELTMPLGEATLERASAHLLARLRAPVERALRDSGLRSADLDDVVLAGGATRMPMVRRLVTTLFGRFPRVDVDPDQVVALGAAVQAGLKARDVALREVVMTDVAPYSLGVAVSMQVGNDLTHGHFDPIIERNSAVPVSRVKTYFPVREGQRVLDLQVFQGEARLVRDNVPLGRLSLKLPAAPQGECATDVRFTYDVNGLLEVAARVQKTGTTAALVIEGNPGLLTEDEIARCLDALSTLKIHPRDRLEHRTSLARAERLYEMLRGEPRDWLGAQIRAYEQVLAQQELRSAEPARRRLEEILDQLERQGPLGGEPPPA